MPRYFWTQSAPFGDGRSVPGEEYFPEPGRDLNLMKRIGQLSEMPDPPKDPSMAEQDKPQDQPTPVDQERQAGNKGIVTTHPPVQDVEEAAAGVQDADHAGTGSPTRDNLGPLQERMRPFIEAATDPGRPLTADEQVEQGLIPATHPGEQAVQGQRRSPLDDQRAEDPRPATPVKAEADKATAETRDQVVEDPEPGPFTVDPSSPAADEPPKEENGKKGRKAKSKD